MGITTPKIEDLMAKLGNEGVPFTDTGYYSQRIQEIFNVSELMGDCLAEDMLVWSKKFSNIGLDDDGNPVGNCTHCGRNGVLINGHRCHRK